MSEAAQPDARPAIAEYQRRVCAPCGQGCAIGGVAMFACLTLRLGNLVPPGDASEPSVE